ncbi:MAG TPA: gamma-glutamyltransferase [Rhizomicrobium sp.]|nr:gamma-glutamyltransferase [Rhizomicrobium sp.]
MKFLLLAAAAFCVGAQAADLSPAHWPAGTREKAEAREYQGWAPAAAQVRQGSGGIISATVSPVAIEAGLQTLRKGGNAADAAASVALTQVATQLGSVVSYAGIMTALYYDAKTGKVVSLDAGYATYKGETAPASIPQSDISLLTGGPAPQEKKDLGRQTLVPGFMAGMEALEKRFGRLRFADTLAPAIWYAENGVKVSPTLGFFFKTRQAQLSRTEEGKRFLEQAGNDLPQAGDVFRQRELAATLKAVARHGAQTMYTGAWAKTFVEFVRRDGGKVAAEDLAAYRPEWSDAASTTVFAHTVYTNGGTSLAPYQLLTALNAAEAMNLDKLGPYWSDAETFRALNRLGEVVAGAPVLLPATEAALKAKGVDTSPAGQRTKAYAEALAAILPSLYAVHDADTHHSNALVVVDKDGNVAVVTHTINSVIWGDTGIVVGGIPIPDSAGFQQKRMETVAPGARLPNEIADTLVTDGKGRPVLASGCIGSSLLPETLRVIVSLVAQHQQLAATAAAPPLLININPKAYEMPFAQRPVIVPAGAYDADLLGKLRADGTTVAEIPGLVVGSVRGTLALVAIDPDTGARSAPEAPGVMVFSGTE